jgi:hypothetical protein
VENHIFNKIQLISYFVGDVDNDLSHKISEHLKICPSCSDYIIKLEGEKNAFLKTHAFEEIAFQEKSVGDNRLSFRIMPKIYGLAASFLVFITAGFSLLQHFEPGSRIKGEVNLKLFVKNSSGAIEKRGEQRYYPGEKVQFLYSCGSRNKFILISVDTSGTISQYYPSQGDSSISLDPGQEVPLPHSILLDRYIGKELFIGIFSEKSMYYPAIKKVVKSSFDQSRSLDSISGFPANCTAIKYVLSVETGARQ